MIEVYSDYHTPTIVYARDEDGWHIVPATSNGWAQRRPWHPSPLIEKRMATAENRVTFFGLPWLAEQGYGIPRDRVAVVSPR